MLASCLIVAVSGVQAPEYTATVLDPTFHQPTYAVGINNDGVVAGITLGDEGYQSFVWKPGGLIQVIPHSGWPGALSSQATDLNENGELSGYVSIPGGNTVAARWCGESWELMDPGTYYTDSVASGLNDTGIVVGEVITQGGFIRPAVWEDGVFTELPMLYDLWDRGTAIDVNDQGQIVGYCMFSFQIARACYWVKEPITDSDSGTHEWVVYELIIPTPMTPLNFAYAVNEAGQAGAYSYQGGLPLASLLNIGQFNRVPIPGSIEVRGMNVHGHLVGFSVAGATIWTPEGGTHEIADPLFGGLITSAWDINDFGDVVVNTDLSGMPTVAVVSNTP